MATVRLQDLQRAAPGAGGRSFGADDSDQREAAARQQRFQGYLGQGGEEQQAAEGGARDRLAAARAEMADQLGQLPPDQAAIAGQFMNQGQGQEDVLQQELMQQMQAQEQAAQAAQMQQQQQLQEQMLQQQAMQQQQGLGGMGPGGGAGMEQLRAAFEGGGMQPQGQVGPETQQHFTQQQAMIARLQQMMQQHQMMQQQQAQQPQQPTQLPGLPGMM